MPFNEYGVPLVCADHVEPFFVRIIVPPSPTAVAFVVLEADIERKIVVVPLVAADHEDPPFVVLSSVPPSPHTHPTLVPENAIPYNEYTVPLV
jgi:hypothetical protein